MAISFNPSITTSPQTSFQSQTRGGVVGTFMDDPTSKMWLQQGILGGATALYGGTPITEFVPTLGSNLSMGPVIGIAASTAAVTGLAVFTQAHAMIIAPGANVPMASPGMSVNIFRLGSNARIWVKIDASGLPSTVDGDAINTQVSWNYANNCLQAYSVDSVAFPCKILTIDTNSLTISTAAGISNWAAGSAALIQI